MSILSMLGNPWNPMPGWLHPGLADDPDAPLLTIYNRGAFDAQGLPYAFQGVIPSALGDSTETFRRVLAATGGPGFLDAILLEQLTEAFGEDGLDVYVRLIRDAFVFDRNGSHSLPSPFWHPSDKQFVLYQSAGWILACNCNIPPGYVPPDYPDVDPSWIKFGGWPLRGDDSRRWSLWPRSAPSQDAFGEYNPYPLYQTFRDAGQLDNDANILTAQTFPFPFLQLFGISGGLGAQTLGRIIQLYPVNP
jgi:hypothetical protein